MRPIFVVVIVALVLILFIFISITSTSHTTVNRKDTYSLKAVPIKDLDKSVDTYYLDKEVVLNHGDGVKIDLSGHPDVGNIPYYEFNIYSKDKETCFFTIPYLKTALVRVPNDIIPGTYTIYVKTVSGTIMPNRWFKEPIISFKTVKRPELVKVKSYIFKSDKEVYHKLGDKFKELTLSENGEFIGSLSSTRKTFEKDTSMITTETLDLDLKGNQKALCIIPNRNVTVDNGVKSVIKVNGEEVNSVKGAKFIYFEVTGKTTIIETTFGNHYSIVTLPFYAYIFSTLVKE